MVSRVGTNQLNQLVDIYLIKKKNTQGQWKPHNFEAVDIYLTLLYSFFFKIFIDLLNGDLTKKGFKLKRILTFFLH